MSKDEKRPHSSGVVKVGSFFTFSVLMQELRDLSFPVFTGRGK
jgi:hypothetical protein